MNQNQSFLDYLKSISIISDKSHPDFNKNQIKNTVKTISTFLDDKTNQLNNFIVLSNFILSNKNPNNTQVLQSVFEKKIQFIFCHSAFNSTSQEDKKEYKKIISNHFFSFRHTLQDSFTSKNNSSGMFVTIDDLPIDVFKRVCKSIGKATTFFHLFENELPIKLFLEQKEKITVVNFATIFQSLSNKNPSFINFGINQNLITDTITKIKDFENLEAHLNHMNFFNYELLRLNPLEFKHFINTFYNSYCTNDEHKEIFYDIFRKIMIINSSEKSRVMIMPHQKDLTEKLHKDNNIKFIKHFTNLLNEISIEFQSSKFNHFINYEFLLKNYSEIFSPIENYNYENWHNIISTKHKEMLAIGKHKDDDLEITYENHVFDISVAIRKKAMRLSYFDAINGGAQLLETYSLNKNLNQYLPIQDIKNKKNKI